MVSALQTHVYNVTHNVIITEPCIEYSQVPSALPVFIPIPLALVPQLLLRYTHLYVVDINN